MKILLMTEFFPDSKKLQFTGGVETRTYYIAKNLAKNAEVLLIHRRTKKKVEAGLFSVAGRIIFMLRAFLKGLTMDFDIVEGSNFVTYLPAFLAGWFKRKSKIAWFADVLGKDWFKYFGITGFFGYLVEKISLKLNWNKVIALSKQTKKKLVQAGIDKSKIDVVYGGVDLKKLKTQMSDVKTKTQSSKPKNIICISRLVRYKRINDLIRAFAVLVKEHPSLSLTIVGQGPEEIKLKQLAKKLNIGLKIKFLRNLPRNKLINILQESYLLCLPSVIEGFGLITIEAAACGTPYVISNIKVNQEITKNGQGGLLFEKKNIGDLVKNIEKLLKNKKFYQKKQMEGLNLVKDYDWFEIARQTLKVYDKAIYE